MEKNSIKVIIKDFGEKEVNEGITLLELSKNFNVEGNLIVAGKVDNELRELTYKLFDNCKVEFIDLKAVDGMRIYKRSLSFLLFKAFYDLFPKCKVKISHAISRGFYFEISGDQTLLSSNDVDRVEKRMRELVSKKIPFEKKILSIKDATDFFLKQERVDRLQTILNRSKTYVTIYNCDSYENYFYGYMVPDTSFIQNFNLKIHGSGILLMFPSKANPLQIPEYQEQEKLFKILNEHKKWVKILKVENIGSFNEMIKQKGSDLINIAEALHEKKIAAIADMIYYNKEKKKVVLIAGPSSSGKTTFAKRLSIQLRVNGLKPVTISLDDYFVDREKTPKDDKGDYDFESLDAIDVELFNDHLNKLINGEEVEIPLFNFQEGKREETGRKLKINDDNVLVIEGIHGLNEKLTNKIPKSAKFKIYVSALTSVNIDDHNRIPTTDTRIIRRIVRDFNYRGCSAENTIKRWPSVRAGEEKNIFPFQEDADIMFNSFLIFELGVLKKYAEPLLLEVDRASSAYSEARRLTEFLSYFVSIDLKTVPLNSIIREFAGGSCFSY